MSLVHCDQHSLKLIAIGLDPKCYPFSLGIKHMKVLFASQIFFDPTRILLGVTLVQFFGGIMKHALKPLRFIRI